MPEPGATEVTYETVTYMERLRFCEQDCQKHIHRQAPRLAMDKISGAMYKLGTDKNSINYSVQRKGEILIHESDRGAELEGIELSRSATSFGRYSQTMGPETWTRACSSSAGDPRSKEQKKQRIKNARKRKRGILLSFPPVIRSIASNGSSHSGMEFLDVSPAAGPHELPDLQHFINLLSTLVLTSTLGMFSALDAKQECVKHETYALLDLVDDDNFQAAYYTAILNEAELCIHMFRHVVIPSALLTGLLGGIGIIVLARHIRKNSRIFRQQSESNMLSSEHLVSTLTAAIVQRTFRISLFLLFLVVILLGVQSYHVTNIMLQPREDNNSSSNPYQSLAAVDRFGHVGYNANLYYMTWVSECLALALVYQVTTACVRLWRARKRMHEEPAGLLRTTSWDVTDHLKKSSTKWYSSLYELRMRTGIWVAALVSNVILTASSQYVWRQVFWPVAKDYFVLISYMWNEDDALGEAVDENDRRFLSNNGGYESAEDMNYWSICQLVASHSDLPAPLCRRTVTAWLSGAAAAFLSAVAITLHLVSRRKMYSMVPGSPGSVATVESWYSLTLMHDDWVRLTFKQRLPLHSELALSILLSLLLGINAVLCTGVQGPAATVGNLYYSSWFAFLLSVRLCLACVEEHYNFDDEESEQNRHTMHENEKSKAKGYQSPSLQMTTEKAQLEDDNSDAVASASSSSSSNMSVDKKEKARKDRVRSYFFLFVFSIVCAAAAYDAALNQQSDPTKHQQYLIIAPGVVAGMAAMLFLLSLSKFCYAFVARFAVGGVLSIVMFGILLGNLVLTMHAEDSWAVNSIGEIEMANLYYFSWACILTAGLHMMSFVKALIGIKETDYVSVVWAAICKVCFVILGAALHIWHTIADNCGFDEITLGAVTFCSRTVLAMIVALTGMFVGGSVVFGRLVINFCPSCQCRRLQTHVEMLISLFLVFLFGAAVALITGIGGPGQSVGDLYYSTWLAFFVSIGIFGSCYHELQVEETEVDRQDEERLESMKVSRMERTGALV